MGTDSELFLEQRLILTSNVKMSLRSNQSLSPGNDMDRETGVFRENPHTGTHRN